MPTFVASAAILAAIFLNGANIDGVRSQTFERCTAVRVDEKGDVHLDCPGYQVETPRDEKGAAPAPQTGAPAIPLAAASLAPAQLGKRYWLVTEQVDGGAAQYDVDVFVNSKWVRKVKSGEEQIVMEITKLLQPGQNKLLFAARKHLEAGRRSSSAQAALRLIVGEGEAGNGKVMIDNPLLECKRTAAETDNVNEEFTVQAR
jgi:hypothetical protein